MHSGHFKISIIELIFVHIGMKKDYQTKSIGLVDNEEPKICFE